MNHRLNYYLLNGKHLTEMFATGKVFTLQNWPDLVTDYLGLADKGQGIIKVKNGPKFKITYKTTDKWSIHEILFRDDYKLDQLIDQCKVIFDLGANIGVFSVYAASLKKDLKVFAFEPDPKNFLQFVNNINLNKMTNKIFPNQIACSDKKSVMNFYISSDHRAHSLSKKSPNFIKVKTDTLENLLNKNKVNECDLLKLDIEGGEYPIFFKTTKQTLERIKNIVMEYHNLDRLNNGETLDKFLKKLGFKVEKNESIQHIVGSIYATRT